LTVADIAKALRMSPANIYRFFDSKKSINLCFAGDSWARSRRNRKPSPTRREAPPNGLRDLLTSIHRMNSAHYVGDAKMHEMVAAAMEENWDVYRPHMECITGIIAKVITAGIAAGERCRFRDNSRSFSADVAESQSRLETT
jgi:AcrR family transcriptional regulator